MKICVLKYNFILPVMIFTIACQEIYDPEFESQITTILVVEGKLTNTHQNSSVKLSQAAHFGSRNPGYINNASVSIQSNNAIISLFSDNEKGMYLPDKNQLMTNPDSIYELTIMLPDGTVYKSAPSVMPHLAIIDSVYAEAGKIIRAENNTNGDLILNEISGLHVYVDVKTPISQKQYYRVKNKILFQSLFFWYKGLDALPVYSWKIIDYEDIPNIIASTEKNNNQWALKNKADFLEYGFNLSSATDSTSPVYPMGWIVMLDCYAIDKATYQYYKDIKEQLNASESVFAPIPSQIEGNMKCISDSEQLVFGNFEVSMVNSNTTGFYWEPGMDDYMKLSLKDFKIPSREGKSINKKPDFWVDFNNEK